MTESIQIALAQSKNYRVFLKLWLEIKNLSFSALARRSGFSRSFPRDVVVAKRRLSAKSFPKLLNGMNLGAAERKLFELLVSQEERDVCSILGIKRDQLELKLTQARNRLALGASSTNKSPFRSVRPALRTLNESERGLLTIPNVVSITAALGTPQEGATLEEIEVRLPGIGRNQLQRSLAKMCALGICEEREKVYYPKSWHEQLSGLGKNQFFFKIFQEASLAGVQKAMQNADSSEELFFVSSFLVSQERLPDLKEKLRSLLNEFIDDNIDPCGRVVQISTSMSKV